MYTNSRLVANQAVTLTKAVANNKIENGQLKCSGGLFASSEGTFLSQYNTFEFQYAVPNRVQNINFKPMSSAADDDTSSRFLKYIEITVASTLCNLMSQSLSTGIFSYQLKLA